MLKTLLKKQITEIFRGYFFNPKTGKRRSGGATAAMLCCFGFLMIAVLGGMFALLSYVLCAPLRAAGLGWMYFAMMGLLASFFGVFGSVFNTYAGLYLANDDDLLLSMPIPIRTILCARLLGLMAGLRFPNLSWTNETVPIKQSGSVLLTLSGGIGYTLLMGGGYFLLGFGIGATGYLGPLCSVNAALAAVLYLWLCKKGTALFAAL